MAKKIQIKCSCGETYSLPKEVKGSLECPCGERYGVNEKPEREVIVQPRPYVQPYRPYWPYQQGPWYGGGTRITSGSGPQINSGGGFSNVISVTDMPKNTIAAISDGTVTSFKL